VERATRYYGGQDLAKTYDFSALAVISVEKPEGSKESVAQLRGLKVWGHCDYSIVFEDTDRIYQRYLWRKLSVDQGNVGEYAVEEYKKRGIPYEGVKFTAPSKHALIQLLVMMLQDKRLSLPARSYPELKRQIAEQERVIRASESPLYEHPEGKHDDMLWALCLALHAARKELVRPRALILSPIDKGWASLDWAAGWEQSYPEDRRFTSRFPGRFSSSST
jgi:hypothetical protein